MKLFAALLIPIFFVPALVSLLCLFIAGWLYIQITDRCRCIQSMPFRRRA